MWTFSFFLNAYLSFLQVPGEVAWGALSLPHVQQTHSWSPRTAPQHRDTAGWAGVRFHVGPSTERGTMFFSLKTQEHMMMASWGNPVFNPEMLLLSNHHRDGSMTPCSVWEMIFNHPHIAPPLFFLHPTLRGSKHYLEWGWRHVFSGRDNVSFVRVMWNCDCCRKQRPSLEHISVVMVITDMKQYQYWLTLLKPMWKMDASVVLNGKKQMTIYIVIQTKHRIRRDYNITTERKALTEMP